MAILIVIVVAMVFVSKASSTDGNSEHHLPKIFAACQHTINSGIRGYRFDTFRLAFSLSTKIGLFKSSHQLTISNTRLPS